MVKETGFTPEYVKEAGEYTPGSFLSSAFSNRLFGPTNEDILWGINIKGHHGACTKRLLCNCWTLR